MLGGRAAEEAGRLAPQSKEEAGGRVGEMSGHGSDSLAHHQSPRTHSPHRPTQGPQFVRKSAGFQAGRQAGGFIRDKGWRALGEQTGAAASNAWWQDQSVVVNSHASKHLADQLLRHIKTKLVPGVPACNACRWVQHRCWDIPGGCQESAAAGPCGGGGGPRQASSAGMRAPSGSLPSPKP